MKDKKGFKPYWPEPSILNNEFDIFKPTIGEKPIGRISMIIPEFLL
jgi:hypothetical protein